MCKGGFPNLHLSLPWAGRAMRPVSPGPGGVQSNEVLLWTGYPGELGAAYYSNGHWGHAPTGFYRITMIVKAGGDIGYLTYGVMVFPVVVAECLAKKVQDIINHPVDCEHFWHWGPGRPAPVTVEESRLDEERQLKAREAAG
jgi:hypothetical protein